MKRRELEKHLALVAAHHLITPKLIKEAEKLLKERIKEQADPVAYDGTSIDDLIQEIVEADLVMDHVDWQEIQDKVWGIMEVRVAKRLKGLRLKIKKPTKEQIDEYERSRPLIRMRRKGGRRCLRGGRG